MSELSSIKPPEDVIPLTRTEREGLSYFETQEDKLPGAKMELWVDREQASAQE